VPCHYFARRNIDTVIHPATAPVAFGDYTLKLAFGVHIDG
jgi:hypothetical protein